MHGLLTRHLGTPGSPAQAEWLQAVQWRDLLHLRRSEIAGELLLSLPWLAASLLAAANGHHLVALACSFMHLEHHMFPAVPTCKLPILVGRIDAEVPGLRLRYVY